MFAGPLGRLLTSARMYQNSAKVAMFCRFVGIMDSQIPSSGWRFFVQLLHCIKSLQEDEWQAVIKVCGYYLTSSACLP